MGDEAAHPGRAGNHAKQCDNIEQVRAKGREAFMVENNMDNNDIDALYNVIKKYEQSRKNLESVKKKKDEAYDMIKDMVKLNDEYDMDDFENLFYCFNMLVVAYGAVGNLYAVTHYLKEINNKCLPFWINVKRT